MDSKSQIQEFGFAHKVVTRASWVDEYRTGSGSARVCVAWDFKNQLKAKSLG